MAVSTEDLYRKYGPMVLRRCRKLLRNEAMAKDAMQDVFTKGLERQEQLTADAPSSFLFRVATNVCLNKIRASKRRREDAASDLVIEIAEATRPDPEVRNVLRRLFASEKLSTQSMAIMHFVDGMTLEEVAAEHSLSVSGVRKRLRQLREHLHELTQESA